MNRVLTWGLDNPVVIGTHKRRFVMNGKWRPVEARIYAATPSVSGTLIIDINADGTSIFATRPALDANHSLKRHRTFGLADNAIADGEVMSLDVDQQADSIDGVTVELELKEA